MHGEALLVINMLNDFVLEGASLEVPDTRKAVPAIGRAITDARDRGTPVIYVCDAHEKDDREFAKFGWPAHAVGGTEGAEVVKELSPEGNDRIIRKPTYSSFYNTGLDDTLKELNADSLVLTGCVTHICILFAAAEAVLRDYSVSVIEAGVAGLAPDDHEAALRIMKNVLGVIIL